MAVNNRVKITNDIELKDRLVAINRVTKVTKGGRTFSFSAIVVVGNEDGIIGWGLGKAGEVTAAIAKGVEAAKKNLTRVPVLKGTVPHEQSAKFGGAEVFIKPASTGTGVVAGGAMRAVLESAGIHDVLAKSKGSSNPHNAGLLDVQQAFSQFFGGTSLLILVGVVIDTLQQVESHLLMRHYDGLLNSGHTRQGGVAAY